MNRRMHSLSLLKRSGEQRAAEAALARLGYDIDPRRTVGELAESERTAVGVARALDGTGDDTPFPLLVLDEATAALPGAEVARLFAAMRLVAERGTAVLFISHYLDEVLEIADRVTVLRDGRRIATEQSADLTHERLANLMLGRELVAESAAHTRVEPRDAHAEPVLSLRGVGGAELAPIDLDVQAGEVVGIAGLTGSGRDELASLLSGRRLRVGEVRVDGRVIPQFRPRAAIDAEARMTPAMSLSRTHRDTWTSTGSSGPGRPSPMMTAGLPTVPVPPSRRTNVAGPGRRRAIQHAQRRQDSPHGIGGERLVLRRERVDRRRDDPGLVGGNPRRDLIPAREHAGLRRGQVRPQELPPRPGHLVFPVHADVASPHHPGARVCQRRGQPGGLRVMQQHHIAGPDPGRQLHRVRGQHLRVMSGLRRAERGSGRAAVDLVVQPLGDREEPGVAGDHQPADRDVQVLHVSDQDLQHLGDPATSRGRIDVPDGAPGQHRPELLGCPDQLRISRGADDRLQPGHGQPRHLHRMHQAHGIRLPARTRSGPSQGVACLPGGR